MYKLTRQEAAGVLGISTRSVDRYVKSGKLRSKKKGKVVYINSEDIESMSTPKSQKQEVIIPKEQKSEEIVVKEEKTSSGGLDAIYSDLKSEISKKDTIIQELSIRLGKAEEITKNSISLIEFKKSQFLLEESKGYLSNEVIDLKKEKHNLAKNLRYEKNSNIILTFFIIVLLIIAGALWFAKV